MEVKHSTRVISNLHMHLCDTDTLSRRKDMSSRAFISHKFPLSRTSTSRNSQQLSFHFFEEFYCYLAAMKRYSISQPPQPREALWPCVTLPRLLRGLQLSAANFIPVLHMGTSLLLEPNAYLGNQTFLFLFFFFLVFLSLFFFYPGCTSRSSASKYIYFSRP
ncbi:hypothetical protein ABW19_dt0206758 [Dactylella cylindrospora]|nr:hypothetical protein ABW19_dt0206758 [Dactylella cylindrospora]